MGITTMPSLRARYGFKSLKSETGPWHHISTQWGLILGSKFGGDHSTQLPLRFMKNFKSPKTAKPRNEIEFLINSRSLGENGE